MIFREGALGETVLPGGRIEDAEMLSGGVRTLKRALRQGKLRPRQTPSGKIFRDAEEAPSFDWRVFPVALPVDRVCLPVSSTLREVLLNATPVRAGPFACLI